MNKVIKNNQLLPYISYQTILAHSVAALMEWFHRVCALGRSALMVLALVAFKGLAL